MIDRAKTIKERRRVCLDGHYGSGSLTETPSIENLEIYCEMIRKKASLETVLEGAKLIKRLVMKSDSFWQVNINKIIDSGIVKLMVELFKNVEAPYPLKLELAWIFTNLAMGNTEST